MPTNRTPRSRGRRQLSGSEEMTLWLGAPPANDIEPGFASEDDAREAWFRNRERLMAHFASNGKRPLGWWWFESSVPFPGYFKQRSTLFEHDLLDAAERAELLAYWREEFERSWSRDFFFCDGPGEFYEGAAARRKHFAHCDIPTTLIELWTQARRKKKAPTQEDDGAQGDPMNAPV
jgi:hypothetical protein